MILIYLFFIHLLALASPGPDIFFIAQKAAKTGFKTALQGVVGIVLGLVVWVLATVFGLAALFHKWPMLQGVLMVLGGLYLGYIGVILLRVKTVLTDKELLETEVLHGQTKRQSSALWQGFSVNLSNAKALIYFSGIFSLLMGHFGSNTVLVLATLMILLESFLFFSLIAYMFSRQKIRNLYLKNSVLIDKLTGFVFLIFAIVLIIKGLRL